MKKLPCQLKKKVRKKKMDVISGRRNFIQWLRQETVSQMC